MFASQPLEAAINRIAPRALEETRLPALRRAEQVQTNRGVDHHPTAAPEEVQYTELEKSAIKVAVKLLSLIWLASQPDHAAYKLDYELKLEALVQHPLNPLNRWHVFFCRLNFVYHGLHPDFPKNCS